jgi:protein-S-isoprenylcysteine O-methyltransferase Ste14
MTKPEAALGSAAFFFIAPGVVAGLFPFLITHWRLPADAPLSALIIGALMIAVSLAALIECFVRFARQGPATPPPAAPTERLVVTRLYRHVRNPMYVAVLGNIFGQMLIFQHAALLAYGVTVWLAFLTFVLSYEEPTLRHRYPDDYPAYFENVPRWLPRFTPWRGPAPNETEGG